MVVDQVGPGGVLVSGADLTLSEKQKNEIVAAAVPGATVDTYAGQRVLRFRDQIILKAQITYLGIPHPIFKKRIQISRAWVNVAEQAQRDGLRVRFIGIYRYGETTLFADFDPATYIRRKANNSAAHVSTNDLYQAYVDGTFWRVDANGNRLTTVRSDLLRTHLLGEIAQVDPSVEVFRRFNAELFTDGWVHVLDAVNEMHAASWPDRFQSEWQGFYLEYRFDSFVRANGLDSLVRFQKEKRVGRFDADLVFPDGPYVSHYGDLKTSNIVKRESPGNDADAIRRCVNEYGKFWYVIYDHATTHARDTGGQVTVAWNRLRRSLGQLKTDYNDLSYSSKLKEAVSFRSMRILEVNPANFHVILDDFHQGVQVSGAERALKVIISKRNVDNFLIYSETL
ncbi:hypothetical protein [Pseudactinotalea terrae]|uniref:hypothetical protein n=1 Tax=Pseudactinotalea terrae TaxID=1743262 RepID=UPI001F4F8A73|nr:hypothetical protein [Pseudactinotalea terrae]